jgi:outer membrane receptor protein involved in Fe transport
LWYFFQSTLSREGLSSGIGAKTPDLITMNHTTPTFKATLSCLIALVFAPCGFGQKSIAEDEDDEEVFTLSPFEVTGDSDIGYQAIETLAGTRLRTELRDVGNAITVINEEFLKDTGAKSTEDLFVYTVGTEVGGVKGNFTGAGDGTRIAPPSSVEPQNNTRVRGLFSVDHTRDFFLTFIPWDTYNVNRVDIQRGPNSILFGIGSPAGISNTNTKQPMFETIGKAEIMVDDESTFRSNLDYNLEVLDNQLAVRLAALTERQKYQQEPAFEDDDRLYGAVRYEPKFLEFNGRAKTIIRFNGETGKITANRPRPTPPVDRITPWFTDVRETFDPRTIRSQKYEEWVELGMPSNYGGASSILSKQDGSQVPNPNYQPYIDGAGSVFFDGPILIYDDPNSPDMSRAMVPAFSATRRTPLGLGTPWNPGNFGVLTYELYSQNAQLRGNEIGAYKEKVITDPSIFNFYKRLLDGDNKREYQDWKAYNGSISQTFWRDRIGLEAAIDYQEMDSGTTNPIGWNGYAISFDTNEFYTTGEPNPNVGRPYVGTRGGNNRAEHREREAYRLTAYLDFDFRDFMDADSWLAKGLGRHVITGLKSGTEFSSNSGQWSSAAAGNDSYEWSGFNIAQANRSISTLSYIGPDMRGMASAAGAKLQGIGATRLPPRETTVPLFDWTTADPSLDRKDLNRYVGYTPNPLTVWSGDTDDRQFLYTYATNEFVDLESEGVTWQAYLLSDKLIFTGGWRKDSESTYRAAIPALYNDQDAPSPELVGTMNLNDPNAVLPDEPLQTVTGESLTWGVVLHSPEFVNKRLPWNSNFSLFYYEGENFQPASGRVDVFGQPIASPSGTTRDYGFTASAMNNRFILKVNWYDTKVKDATVTDSLPENYLVGYGEAWAYQFATMAKTAWEEQRGYGAFQEDFNNPAKFGGKANGEFFLPYQPAPDQTVEEARDEMLQIFDAFFAKPAPIEMQNAWGYNFEKWEAGDTEEWINITYLNGMAVTGDVESKGVEIEFTAQVTPNWNLTLNAAKTTAIRRNLAEGYAKWVDERWEWMNTQAGEVRFWGGHYGPGMATYRSKYLAEFYGGYSLQRLLEGAPVPEMRPWRFNLVTNYSFRDGTLQGLNIGGGYRWQDKIVIGYPVIDAELAPFYKYDIDNPFYGPVENNVDLWVGYERQISEGVKWRIQLNVRNAFGKNELIPITVQPDGSGAAYRISEGRSFFVTNSFTF